MIERVWGVGQERGRRVAGLARVSVYFGSKAFGPWWARSIAWV